MTANKTKKKKQIAKKNAAKKANLANHDLSYESLSDGLESPQFKSSETFAPLLNNDEHNTVDLSSDSSDENDKSLIETISEEKTPEESICVSNKDERELLKIGPDPDNDATTAANESLTESTSNGLSFGVPSIISAADIPDQEIPTSVTHDDTGKMDLSQESSTDTFNKLHDHVKEGFILDSYTEKIPPSPSGTLNSPLENSVQVIVQATTQDTTGPSGFSPILESASEPHENNQEKNVEISLIAPSKEFQSHLSLGSLHEFSHESAQPFIEELAQDLSEVSLVDFDEPIQTHSEKLLLNSSEDNKLVGPERLNQDKSDLSSQESIKENLQKSSDSLSSMQTDTVQDPIQENVIESRVTAETFSPELIYEPNEKPQTLPKETPLIQNESKVEINDDSNQSFAFTNEDSFFDNIDKVEATIPETLDEPSADGVPSSTSHDDPFVSSKTEGGYFGSLKTSDNHLTSAAIQKYPLSSSPVRDEFSTEDILSDPVKGSLRPNDDDWHDTNLVNSQPVKGSTNLVSKADNFSVPIEPTQHSETESTDNLVEDDSVEKVSIEEKELPKITPDNFSPELHPFVPKKSNRNSLFANDMDDAFFLALASEDSSKDEKTKSHKKRHSLFGGNYSEDPFFTSLEKLTSTVEEDETVNETKVDSELIDSFKEKENVQESSIPETEVTEDNLFVTNDNNDPFVFIQSEDSNKTQFSEQMDKDLSVSNLTSEETGASAIELNPFELLEDDEDFLDDEVNETTTSKEGSRPAMKPEASFAFLADDDDILSDEDNSNIIENVYTAPGHTTAVTQNSQKHLATLTNNTNRATSNAYDFPTNLLARNLTQPAVPTFMNVQQQSSQASKMNANPVNLARPHSSLASKTSSKSFFGDLPLPNKRPANRVASAQPLIIQPSLSPLVGVPPRLSTMTPPSNPYAPKVVPASPSINRNFAVSPTILFANNGLSNNHTAGMTLSPSIPEDKPINNLPPQAFNPSPMYASNSQIQPGTPAHNSYAPAAQQYAHASHSRNISGGYNSPILRSSSVASNSSRLNDGSVPLKRPSLATSTISSTTNSAYGDLPFAFEQPARKHDNMRRMSNSSIPPPPSSILSSHVHPNREYFDTPLSYTPPPQPSLAVGPPVSPYRTTHPATPASNPYSYNDGQKYHTQAYRSAVNPNELLGRQFPIFHWGAYGKTVSMVPPSMSFGSTSTRAEIKLRSVSNLMKIDKLNCKFPGPLIPYSKPPLKSKKKDVEKWMKEKIVDLEGHLHEKLSQNHCNKRYEHRILLFKVVGYLLQNDGSISLNETSLKDLRHLLCPDLTDATNSSLHFSSVSQIYSKPSQSDQNSRANGGLEKVLNNKDSADLYNYLRLGEKENAIRYAMDKGYWAHALLIASAVSPAHWSNTVEEFVKENIRPLESPNASNIAFLYKLFGGSGAEAVGELTASRGPVSLSKAYDRPVDNWCDILWLALSNITPQSGSAIVALGDSLLGTGMIEAAHICFILSGIPGFGLPEEQVGSFSLLGSDRRYSAAQFGCDTDSIILSEVYEFCLSLRNDVSFVPVINNLLYKSYLTTVLADHGLFTEARRYNDAVLAGIKSIPKGLSITPSFINTVQNLSQRLLESPADSSSNWLVGKLSKPNLENVWGTIDKNLSKFVTGDDASSKTEFQEREKGIFGHYSRAQSAADIPSIVNLTNTTNTATSGVSMSLYSATTSPGYSSSANLYPAGSQNQSKYNRPFEQDEANMPLYMNTVPSANRASLTVSPIARPTQHDMSLPTGASSVGPKGSDTQPALTSYGSGDSSTLSTGTSAIYNPYAPAKLTESGKLEHATQSYVSEGYVDKTGPNISLASTANTMYNPYAPVSGHESKSEAGYQPVTTTVRQSTTTSGSNLSLPSLSRAPDVSSQFISEKHQYSSPNLGMPSHPVNPYAPTFEPKMPSNYSPYAVSSPGPVQARPVLPYNNAESASDIHSHVPPEPLDRNETSYSLPRPSTATTPVNKLFKASSSNQSLRSLSSHNIRQNISSGSQIEIPESELKPMNRENSLSSVHHLYGLENQGITLIDSGELNDPPIEPKDSHFSKSNLTPSPSYGSTEQPVQLSHIGTRNEIDESRGDEGSFDYISHADENSSIVERPYDSTEGFEDRNRYELREEFCPASIHSPSSISYVPSESGGEIVNGEGNQSSQLNNDGDMSEHVTLNLSKSPLNPYAPISNTSKFTNSYTPEISSYNPYSPIPKSESGGNYTPQNYAPQESVKYVEENLAENLSTPYEDSGYNPYSALYGSTADGDNTGSISEKDGLCVESEVNPEYTVTTPTYETRMLEEVEQVVNISEPVYQQPSYGIEADEEPSTASSDSYNGGDFFTPLSSSSVYAPMAMNTGVIPKVVPLSQSSARTPVVREDEDEEVEDLGFSNKPKKLESEKKKENEAEKKKADEEKKGWFGGWFHKKGDQQNVVKAKLGEESSFYYDEKLKRWVNKNASAEEETVNVGPPPPPMKVSSANSGVTSPSASSLPPASLAPLPPAIPKPKISTTGGLDDLLSVAPPLGGARKPVKKNARSRYVDVLNP